MSRASALAGPLTSSGYDTLLLIDQAVLDAVPAAISLCAADGTIVRYNRRATELWGRGPALTERGERFSGALRLYDADGVPLAPSGLPVATALLTAEPVYDREIVIEQPDGSRIPVLVNAEPFLDAAGRIEGAIICFQDIAALKRTEEDLVRRMDEQAALYRFTDRLYRAESIYAVYDAGLDAIVAALGCRRASLLLFDHSGVMRFVAWRGLSDEYRKAVEGHSPWKPGDRDPEPVFVEDIDAANESESLKATVRKEGIAALAFIPLVANGAVVGKFMTYYAEPHTFSGAEIDLAVTIARQLGFSIERHRAEQARHAAEESLRQSEERMRLATQSGRVGLWEWDILGNRVTWTDSIYGIHGIGKGPTEMTVERFQALVHPEDRARVAEALKQTLSDGAPYEIEFRAVRPDGRVRWLFANAMALRDGERITRLLGATFDVTDRKQAELHRDLLVAELSHRVKNTLATVISIAHQSFSRDMPIEDARRQFDGRIHALAQTHGRLAEANWSGVAFDVMLRDELAPYCHDDGNNVRLSGPSIVLDPKSAVVVGMAFHELATNAAKYGALSTQRGVVEVTWEIVGPPRQLVVRWIETGGPPVAPPQRRGFGRLLLERALATDLKGTVALKFAPSGLRGEITLPLDGPGAAAAE